MVKPSSKTITKHDGGKTKTNSGQVGSNHRRNHAEGHNRSGEVRHQHRSHEATGGQGVRKEGRRNKEKKFTDDRSHSEYHHDQHRKSMYHIIPHDEFDDSDESDEEVVHIRRKKKSKRRKRDKKSNKNLAKFHGPQEDECKHGRKRSSEPGKEKHLVEQRRNSIRPIQVPHFPPPKVTIRADGVKIFPRHPALAKLKPQRPFTMAEIQLRKRCSNVVFAMPPAEDEEEMSISVTNRLIEKIIQYIKRRWFVRLNRKNSLLEISHRLNQRMYHARPYDSWVKRREREKVAERTGFYSSIMEHYVNLGNLQTNTATMVLTNLPPDLRIWLKKPQKSKVLNLQYEDI